MKYTRRELKIAFSTELGTAKSNNILQELWDAVRKGETLSIAEANEFCSFISIAQPVVPNGRKPNLDDYPICRDYQFRILYLMYENNLLGAKPVFDFRGDEISIFQKQIDINKLDSFFHEWEPIVRKFNHKNQTLNYVASETNQEIKQLDKIYKEGHFGYNVYQSKYKSIILHSKYLTLIVQEFFQENNNKPVIANINGEDVEINERSLVHIMQRHFAGRAKQFATNKSFHLDRSIPYEELPYYLKSLLEEIDKSGIFVVESIKFIPFRMNGILYAIWIEAEKRSIKGGEVSYNELKTYYPIEGAYELDRIKKEYDEIPINNQLSAFVKKRILATS